MDNFPKLCLVQQQVVFSEYGGSFKASSQQVASVKWQWAKRWILPPKLNGLFFFFFFTKHVICLGHRFIPCAAGSPSSSQWMTSQGLGTAPESSSSSPAVTAPSPSPWVVLVPRSPGRLPPNPRASPSVWSTGRLQRLHWSRPGWDARIWLEATNTATCSICGMIYVINVTKICRSTFLFGSYQYQIGISRYDDRK